MRFIAGLFLGLFTAVVCIVSFIFDLFIWVVAIGAIYLLVR